MAILDIKSSTTLLLWVVPDATPGYSEAQPGVMGRIAVRALAGLTVLIYETAFAFQTLTLADRSTCTFALAPSGGFSAAGASRTPLASARPGGYKQRTGAPWPGLMHLQGDAQRP